MGSNVYIWKSREQNEDFKINNQKTENYSLESKSLFTKEKKNNYVFPESNTVFRAMKSWCGTPLCMLRTCFITIG